MRSLLVLLLPKSNDPNCNGFSRLRRKNSGKGKKALENFWDHVV